MLLHPEDAGQTAAARTVSTAERHLTVTPLDLRQARFTVKMRGLDQNEVTAFLREAADEYERTLRENDRLRQEVVRIEASLNQFRELEGNLRNTLMTAQRVADDMRQNATQEASLLIREAEGRAEQLLEKARTTLEGIQNEIDGLRLKRREVETSIEATISTLHNSLDFIREQSRRERDDNVAPHRPHVEIASRQT